jgi:branched-chain amino acid transport system permease protein
VLFIANYLAPATLLVIVALGLDLQWGHTGLFNAGVAAFAGVGAYTFGMLATGLRMEDKAYGYPGHWGLATPQDLILSAVIAMIVSGGLGVLIAIPTIKLRADYLAIATLALGAIIQKIYTNATSFSGGSLGLDLVPRPFERLVPGGWISDGVFTLVAGAVALGVVFVVLYIARTPWGRSLKAVREDEEAAEALGRNTTVLKLGAFGLGCAIMGLAGALQASYFSIVLPETLLPAATFTAYVVVIVGGSGNAKGIIIGGYVFYALTWVTQEVKALSITPSWLSLRMDYVNLIIVGLALVIIILFRPQGLLPERRFVPKDREKT